MLKHVKYPLMVLLVMVFCAPTIGADQAVIEIPDRVQVNGQQIRLGDIAELENVDQELAVVIEGIELGNAPRPGNTRKLSREFVKLKLRNNGIEPDNYQLDISRLFTVERGSKTIDSEEITVFVTNYVEEKVMESGDDYDISITRQPRKVEISAVDYSLKIGREVDDPTGSFSLPVMVEVDGTVARRVFVGLEVNLYREVYVARHDLSRGDRIEKDDFELKRTEIDNINREPLLDWEDPLIEEGVLKNSLRQGQILTTGILEKRVLIRRGDKVQARVVVGNIRLNTVVKALNNGKKDDYIEVENTDTGRRFRARVLDSGQVLIEK